VGGLDWGLFQILYYLCEVLKVESMWEGGKFLYFLCE
jgi:hypothetical protein